MPYIYMYLIGFSQIKIPLIELRRFLSRSSNNNEKKYLDSYHVMTLYHSYMSTVMLANYYTVARTFI